VLDDSNEFKVILLRSRGLLRSSGFEMLGVYGPDVMVYVTLWVCLMIQMNSRLFCSVREVRNVREALGFGAAGILRGSKILFVCLRTASSVRLTDLI
jgi:hypothetical protein